MTTDLTRAIRRAKPKARVAKVGAGGRRAWANVSPVLVRELRDQLVEALQTGGAVPCPHLDLAARDRAMFWLVEHPQGLLCSSCVQAYHSLRDEPGQAPAVCDNCGALDPVASVAVVFGVVAAQAMLCAGCAAAAGVS